MGYIWVIHEACKGVGCADCGWQGGFLSWLQESEDDEVDPQDDDEE